VTHAASWAVSKTVPLVSDPVLRPVTLGAGGDLPADEAADTEGAKATAGSEGDEVEAAEPAAEGAPVARHPWVQVCRFGQ